MKTESGRGRLTPTWLAIVALGLASSCVQLTWGRVSANAPVAQDLDGLVVGRSDLRDCVGVLGAPDLVWETSDGHGAALLYGWSEERSWGVRVSVPVSDYASTDFDYDQVHGRTRGVLLLFDAQWRLVAVRSGLVQDLAAARERRPVTDVTE